MAAVRFTGTTVLDSVRYQLFRVDLDTHDTRVDAATGTTAACAGCLDPMCILLTEVEIDVPITPSNVDGKAWFAIADVRNWVAWQADLQLSDCAVAARRTTWGQLKSLYG